MSDELTPERLSSVYRATVDALLSQRNREGYWTGELSASALSTATAVSALALVQKSGSSSAAHHDLIAGGLAWLAGHQNSDGGWGDTVKSISNISTTMLCRAAFHLTGATALHAGCLQHSDGYMEGRYGRTPEEHAAAVRARYGKDRTFAVPILTTCALAGLVSWKEVPSLPFELACFPQSLFRFLRLPVVSYALPALIAIGQAVYHHRPPWNPLARFIRWLARRKSLRVLESIQPSSGGFLEATPLTSFVTLSLASIGKAGHPVARHGVEFLARSVRPDGSWPIDTNLATWVTTLAVNALSAADELRFLDNRARLLTWLMRQQGKERHPYTGAEPGAWGWTDLPGSVPDGDDTPGALLAIAHLSDAATEHLEAARAGTLWLIHLQNSDGGWPTFCRGWGNLPFDRSGVDLTAHAIRALALWQARLDNSSGNDSLGASIDRAIRKGFAFLLARQRADGSWLPLWFGNQHAPNDENPTYGTARALASYRDLDMMTTEPACRGVSWLLSAQNTDGGWGGAAKVASSIEETALAVEVLLGAGPHAGAAVNKGVAWLVEQVEAGGLKSPTPIGFYFAKLWYFEKLYPIIFTVAALGRARQSISCRPDDAHPASTPS